MESRDPAGAERKSAGRHRTPEVPPVEASPEPRGFGPALRHFWKRRDAPYPVVREIGIVVVAVLLGAALLWGLTGQSFPDRPVVVIESPSMMHCEGALGQQRSGDNCKAGSYGRIGTIDPGDLVFVRSSPTRGDVETQANGGAHHYGKSGDVIIYFPGGNQAATPIIHRALFWLQINGQCGSQDGCTFTIEELDLHQVSDLDNTVPRSYGLVSGYDEILRTLRAGPEQSGFITRGDNNPFADQHSIPGVEYPVAEAWVLGKARGEIPWIGLVNLGFRQVLGGDPWFSRAPTDLKVMLVVVVALVVATPWVIERVVRARREKHSG